MVTPEKEEEMLTRIRRQSEILSNLMTEADDPKTHLDYLQNIRKVSEAMDEEDEVTSGDSW